MFSKEKIGVECNFFCFEVPKESMGYDDSLPLLMVVSSLSDGDEMDSCSIGHFEAKSEDGCRGMNRGTAKWGRRLREEDELQKDFFAYVCNRNSNQTM